jgi:hypothetical protein
MLVLEAFESGRPCLLKITDKESIRHEMSVWEAIVEMEKGSDHHLVPLRKLEFTSAKVKVGNMAGGYTDTDLKPSMIKQASKPSSLSSRSSSSSKPFFEDFS